MKKKCVLVTVICILSTSVCVIAQKASGNSTNPKKAKQSINSAAKTVVEYPVVGKPCPNFTLKGIQYYSKQQASLADFKGKYLILDFFTTGCTACFASFPEVNQLRKEFKGKVELILVGYDDKWIRPTFEKFRLKNQLDLPVVYDTLTIQRFKIHGYPKILFVDKNGIVRAMTNSKYTKENIDQFINDQPITVTDDSYDAQVYKASSTDFYKPLLIKGNGGNDTDFLFRSLLLKWNPKDDAQYQSGFESAVGPGSVSPFMDKDGIQLVGADLKLLYRLAFSGSASVWSTSNPLYETFWREPLIETKNLAEFEPNTVTGENMFCYSLYVPSSKASPEFLKEIMQRDLKNYFGYEVQVVKKKMPYWRLIASEEAKINLKTKHPDFIQPKGLIYGRDLPPTYNGVTITNKPTKAIRNFIAALRQTGPPIIDETGISGNIDLTIEADMYDLDDIKRSLRKNGLDLIMGEKEMNVIVISDPVKKSN